MKAIITGLLVAAVSTYAHAKGPVGIGNLKIGMTKADIAAIPSDATVRLMVPLNPYVYAKGSTPTPGEEKFDASLLTPWSDQPFKSVMTFAGDTLTSIYVSFESAGTFEKVQEQIAAKYGAPVIDDKMKEEQCIYRNGANFKVHSGVIIRSWSEAPATSKPAIETRLSEFQIEICPSSLRYGSTGPITTKSLSIGYAKPKKAEPNPF